MILILKICLTIAIASTQSGCMTAMLIDGATTPTTRDYKWVRSTSAFLEDNTLIVNGLCTHRYQDHKGRRISARYPLDQETGLPRPTPQDVILRWRRKSREAVAIPVTRTRLTYRETMNAYGHQDYETIVRRIARCRIPPGPLIIVNRIAHDGCNYNRYEWNGQCLLYADNLVVETANIISLRQASYSSVIYYRYVELIFLPVSVVADVVTSPLQLLLLGIVWSVDWTAPY